MPRAPQHQALTAMGEKKLFFWIFILSCLEPASLRLSALQRVAQLRATVPLVSVCAVYVSYLSMRCTP